MISTQLRLPTFDDWDVAIEAGLADNLRSHIDALIGLSVFGADIGMVGHLQPDHQYMAIVAVVR